MAFGGFIWQYFKTTKTKMLILVFDLFFSEQCFPFLDGRRYDSLLAHNRYGLTFVRKFIANFHAWTLERQDAKTSVELFVGFLHVDNLPLMLK